MLDYCEICGELIGAHQERGEFARDDEHVIAHVQCGLDADLQVA